MHPKRDSLVQLVESINSRNTSRSTPKSYLRAASQRLSAAQFLLNDPDLGLDSAYLGGYAVECALKAVILKRTPVSKRTSALQELESGAKAHNLDFLTSLIRLKMGDLPEDVQTAIVAVSRRWRTDLRYAGARVPGNEAAEFIGQVQIIHNWAERSG